MAGFGYGASSHLMSDESYADEAQDDVLQRSADEDLDDMVQRNIRDVLQQVGANDEAAIDDFPQQEQGRLGQRQRPPPSYDGGAGASAALDSGAHQTSCDDVRSAAAATGPSSSTSQLPQHRPVVRRPQVGASQVGASQQQPRASANTGRMGARRPSTDAGPGGSIAAPRLSSEPSHAGSLGGTDPSAALLDVPGQPEASLRLHKARIKGLEDDLGRANRALLDREKQLTEALRDLKDLRSQAAGWARDKKALEVQVDRAKKQTADAESAARNTESQVREMAKADSRAERERRTSEAEVRARDVRLQRALEEVERYKQLLSEVRAQERDTKGSAQQDSGRLLAENRKLERQRAELIAAFKKQLKLIEVLKRQKVHLEAARALQFSEEEFLKTLEMGAA